MAASLVDDVIEALESHPDPYWAKHAAQRVLDEHMGDRAECDMCAGFGYAAGNEPEPEVELTEEEERQMAAALEWAASSRSKAARGHIKALLAILARVGGDA